MVSCSNLLVADLNGKADPYVKVRMGKSTRKTRCIKKTLDPVFTMGNLPKKSGDLAAAKALLVRAAEGNAKSLGPAHPETATAYYRLGLACHSQGEPAEARGEPRQLVGHAELAQNDRSDVHGRAPSAVLAADEAGMSEVILLTVQ